MIEKVYSILEWDPKVMRAVMMRRVSEALIFIIYLIKIIVIKLLLIIT